jgi:rubrerythrin
MAAKIFYNTDELIEALEQRAEESNDAIGNTRTKIESNEMKGQVAAFNEAIRMVKGLAKGLKEGPNGTSAAVESVA